MNEITIQDILHELRHGARVALLVRHGERNKMDPDDPTFGDTLPLTYEGCRTARKLGASLAEFCDEATFATSPLTRTRMTAALIAEGMGQKDAPILADGRLGNESFYYADASEVLDVFRPENFFQACVEYFTTGEQRGFRNLNVASDELENWIDQNWKSRLFILTTHDCYVAAFLSARKVGAFSREHWVRFLDAGAIIERADGTRTYAFVRTNLSTGIVGVYKRKVSGVVFDFGGVMTTKTCPERVRDCVREMGLDWNAFLAGFAKYRHLMDGDFITMAEMYDLVWADANIQLTPEAKKRICDEDVNSFLDAYRNLATLEWMRELKKAGYKIGILTNMPTSFVPHFKRLYSEYIACADALVISGEESMFKPQKRIYDLLQSRINLPAEELCFIDDVEENCDGARAAGWQAIQFESDAQVRRDFDRIARG